jgi:hypothetical protein
MLQLIFTLLFAVTVAYAARCSTPVILSPTQGSSTYAPTLVISGTSSQSDTGCNTVQVIRDGTSQPIAKVNSQKQWTTTLYAAVSGSQTITAYAARADGSDASSQVSLTFNQIRCPSPQLTSPKSNSKLTTKQPTLSGYQGFDASNIMYDASTYCVPTYVHVDTFTSGDPLLTVTADQKTGMFTATPNDQGIPNGVHSLRKRAGKGVTGGVGNSLTVSVDVPSCPTPQSSSPTGIIKGNKPQFSVSGGGVCRYVQVVVTDSTGAVKYNQRNTLSSSGTWSDSPVTLPIDTSYTVAYTFTDQGAHDDSSTVTNSFSLNSACPTIRLTYPTNGASVRTAHPLFSGSAPNSTPSICNQVTIVVANPQTNKQVGSCTVNNYVPGTTFTCDPGFALSSGGYQATTYYSNPTGELKSTGRTSSFSVDFQQCAAPDITSPGDGYVYTDHANSDLEIIGDSPSSFCDGLSYTLTYPDGMVSRQDFQGDFTSSGFDVTVSGDETSDPGTYIYSFTSFQYGVRDGNSSATSRTFRVPG